MYSVEISAKQFAIEREQIFKDQGYNDWDAWNEEVKSDAQEALRQFLGNKEEYIPRNFYHNRLPNSDDVPKIPKLSGLAYLTQLLTVQNSYLIPFGSMDSHNIYLARAESELTLKKIQLIHELLSFI